MFDLTKVCRLCMHEVHNATKIYSCLTDDIRKLIQKIHGIEVKSDNLPKSLCTQCYQKLQYFSTHLTLVERVQDEIKKLAAIELETNKVKTEPQENEPNENGTDGTEVKAAAIALEESDDSTSTVSHISAQSLENLAEPPSASNARKTLNSSTDKNKPIPELPQRSRSKNRTLNQEKGTPSKSETGKRKRRKSKSEESPNKAKKARPVTLKRVANTSPNRMEYEIANSPHNTERADQRKKATKEPIASTSTPLKAKNDQSITKFFKKANTCETCGTFSKDPAFLKFHEDLHSTSQCPGCSIKIAGEKDFDVNKHIACFLLKSKLSKAELIRMNGMQVTVSKLSHEQIRKEEPKCCTEKLSTNPKPKNRKRQPSAQRVKTKEAKTIRKDRGQTNKSSSNVDIDAPRDERKKSKSKNTTETKGTNPKEDAIESEDIRDISIPTNWNVESPKEKVFWIRSFGTNDSIYIPIRPKKVLANVKLAKTIQIIDGFAKKASETALSLSTNTASRTPLSKAGVSAQDQSSPRAVPHNRPASVFIPVSALNREMVRTDQSPAIRSPQAQKQPSRVPSGPMATIPNNNGIITCIQNSVLLNTSNPSNMSQSQNMTVQKAGLINARRKTVAAEMTRMALNKNFNQSTSFAPTRRYSISLEEPSTAPSTIEQIHAYYQQNTQNSIPNTSAVSLRSINSDHSYTGPNQSNCMTANQSQTKQTQYRQIQPKPAYTLQNTTTPTQSSPQQPQLMTSIARDAFLPSPFPVNRSSASLIAPAVNSPISTITQTQQPKTQLKVLTVADLNAKVPTGNTSMMSQPIPQSDVQVNNSNGPQVSKPRMKLTPLRPQLPETNNVIPDTEAISVSLSKIHNDQIELTLNIRGQRIDYETLNDQQKKDVKQCLLRNNIWREMLGHIKQGKPTQATLNLFKKILPSKERQEFFETFYKR